MATHPYISGAGNISQMIGQLRKSFPSTVTSDIVKRLGIAPNNESYVINTLQFIGVIDVDGKKTSDASQVFSKQKDDDFSAGFEGLIKKSYSSLFDLHGDHVWQLSLDDLITFFRQSDQTSEAIGRRQASVFRVLAALSGYGDVPVAKPVKAKATNGGLKKVNEKKISSKSLAGPRAAVLDPIAGSNDIGGKGGQKDFGLSVRVEINLPSDGTKETYDNIFKSIRENLLNG